MSPFRRVVLAGWVACVASGCLDHRGAYLSPADTTPPTVLASSPVTSGVAPQPVARNAGFSVTFSEEMALESLRGGIQLFRGNTAIELDFTVPTPDVTNDGVERGDVPYAVGFRPAAGAFLDGNVRHTLVFSTILTDSQGNALETEVRLSFLTSP